MTPTPPTVELVADITGHGPVTVLLHGITESARSFDPLVEALAIDATVVAVDLRGHGRSPAGPAYDPASMAADVHALLTRSGLPEPGGPAPLVIGHSMGGLVAVAYGAAFPVRGVVDVDQPLHLAAFQSQVRELEPLLRSEAFPAVMAQVFAAMQGALPDAEVARLSALRAPDPDVVLGVWAPLLELGSEELDALVAHVIGGVTAPVLALHGSDPGPEYAAWLSAQLPTARLEVWEGHGHHPHLVDPDRFVAAVRGFDPAR